MRKIKIYCSSIKYYSLLNKLPGYITPLGLGNSEFPDDWLKEKKGNIYKNHYCILNKQPEQQSDPKK